MYKPPSNSVTVALPTLGCKANRYDSDALARALIERGYTIVPPNKPADVYIVNTCTVTGEADAKSRKTLRRALRLNDSAKLIVTGCYASLEPEQLAAIDGVDAVVSIAEQPRIPEIVERLCPIAAIEDNRPPIGLSASIERTRATVKVQDGCNQRCSFCAVTLARGDVRSQPIEEVVSELRRLVQVGIQEIVLTGIRLDAYGLDRNGSLAELIDETAELRIPRLRLSSLEPIGVNAHLAERLAQHPSLCHHFHICLQSGDDGVLKAMRRGYSSSEYRHVMNLLKNAMPDATFTTDVIVGFPGESDEAFANTCSLVEELGFIKLHIFKFSPRPRTEAAKMTGQIADKVKEERSNILFDLERKLFHQHARKMVGSQVSVLVEHTGKNGDGLTPHYFRVCASVPHHYSGKIVPVIISGFGTDFLLASLD